MAGRASTQGTPRRTSRRSVVGAELDGALLRVVRLDGRRVVEYQCMPATGGHNGGDAMRAVVNRRTPATLAWASPGITVRRAPFPGRADRRMEPAARELLDRHLPGGGSLPGAGMVQPIDARLPSTFAAIVSDSAHDVAAALNGTRCRLVVSPFTLTHDGLYLAIRHSCSELTLVTSGIAVATRQLRAGGLMTETAIAALVPAGGPPEAGHRDAARSRSNLTRAAAGDVHDPEVLAVARRYVAAVAREVHRTVEHWERRGDRCPRTLWVHGPGARLAHLPTFMDGLGYSAAPAPVPDDLDYSAIDEEYRLEAYGALQAALFVDLARPLADLAHISGRAAAAATTAARSLPDSPVAGFEGIITSSGSRAFSSPMVWQRSDPTPPRGIALGTVAVLMAMVLAAVLWWNAGRALDDAVAQEARAERIVASRQAEVVAAASAAAQVAAIDALDQTAMPGWSAAFDALATYLPGDPLVDSLRVTPSRAGLTVTIAVEGADVERWRADLSMTGARVTVDQIGGEAIFNMVFGPGFGLDDGQDG